MNTGALASLGGAQIFGLTTGTSTSGNSNWQYVVNVSPLESVPTPRVPSEPDDAVDWLRHRVAEIEWRPLVTLLGGGTR